MGYMLLFVFFLINLVAFANLIRHMTTDVTWQVVILVWYVILSLIVLAGSAKKKSWAVGLAGLVFLVQLVHVGLLAFSMKAMSLLIIAIIAAIGFFSCMISWSPKGRRMHSHELQPYGVPEVEEEKNIPTKSAAKKTTKKQSKKTTKKSTRKKAKKSVVN